MSLNPIMSDFNPLLPALIAIAVAAFIIGMSRGGFGGALGSMSTPILVFALPAPLAVGLALPMLMFADVFGITAHWRKWNSKVLWGMLPGSVVGLVIGTLVLGQVSARTLQHALGIFTLVYVLYKFWERERNRRAQARQVQPASAEAVSPPLLQGSVMGSLAAFTSTLANAGAPPMMIHLLSLNLQPRALVATTTFYFAVLNYFKIPAFLSTNFLSAESLLLIVWALPLIPLGVWTGILAERRVNKQTFDVIMLGLLALTAVILILK
jgi:hypothetical protein